MNGGSSFWMRIFRNRCGGAALIAVALYVATAIGVEIYSVVCETQNVTPIYFAGDDAHRFLPPSGEYWFGTDYRGRSVMARAVAGCASAVKVGTIAAGIAMLIGVSLGAAA